jgi:hypothetical protein
MREDNLELNENEKELYDELIAELNEKFAGLVDEGEEPLSERRHKRTKLRKRRAKKKKARKARRQQRRRAKGYHGA